MLLPTPQHGVHYYFTTKEQFAKEIGEGKFLEHANVHGNLYGTSVQAVRSVLETGRVCVLDIDVQGARAVRKSGLRAIFVFVAPPSLEDLVNRLTTRGTETAEQITRRLKNAKLEIERCVWGGGEGRGAERQGEREQLQRNGCSATRAAWLDGPATPPPLRLIVDGWSCPQHE